MKLDILIRGAGTVHTMIGPAPRRHDDLLNTAPINGAVVAVAGGRIAFVGTEEQLSATDCVITDETQIIDAQGGDVIPGFVDSHTHLLWMGDRKGEFSALLKGKTYDQITAEGGGINTTVRATRNASVEELLEKGIERAMRMLAFGTTTIEAKTGYALETAGELRLLEAGHRLAEITPQRIVQTFLGAHLVPYDYRDRRMDYIELLVNEMLPHIAQQGYATFCDVFLEHNAFNRDESTRILLSAIELGLRPRIHADEFTDTGGAELAVSLHAASCDHLEKISDASIAALANSDTVATLMPGTSFYLNLENHAPYSKLFSAGCAIALATDFNPGSSPSLSMQGAFALGVLALRMPVEAALCASTINAAYSLGISNETGSIECGKRADLVVLRSTPVEIAYHWGENHARTVICNGLVVAEGGRIVIR